jgi:prepilin-type N-terminal cleavage/methylation domain-containing protein
MRVRKQGFTFIEVLIALVVMLLVMNAVSTFLVGVKGRGGALNQFKQQSKIAQSELDSIIGLEILRKDIEHAGYGLPWNNIPAYTEAVEPNPSILNDSPNPPRGLVSINDPGFTLNNADYLVIKSSNVAMESASKKWTILHAGDIKRAWTTVPADAENLNPADRVIVLSPGSTVTNRRSLVVVGGAFSTTYNNTAAFAPGTASGTRLIYGIGAPDPNPLGMPFNRADFYLSNTNVPKQCAPNTGVLVKRVVRQADGILDSPIALLDCVASMQVLFMLDTDGDSTVDTTSDDLSAFNAQQIREQVKRVQVSILAHEGRKDLTYTQSPTNISVGGTSVDISPNVNYRWKVYDLVVNPDNLES